MALSDCIQFHQNERANDINVNLLQYTSNCYIQMCNEHTVLKILMGFSAINIMNKKSLKN